MDDEFFNVGGDLVPGLGLVGDGGGGVTCYGDPDLLPGFDNKTLGLSGGIGAVVGVDDDVLYKAGDIGIVPAAVQLFHFLAGPCGKGVGAVVRPCPQAGGFPALRHLNHHGDHFLFLGGESRHGQAAKAQYQRQQNCK